MPPPELGVGHAAARVHNSDQRRSGSVAAGGESQGDLAHSACRHARQQQRSGHKSIPTGTRKTRMVRGPQYSIRLSLLASCCERAGACQRTGRYAARGNFLAITTSHCRIAEGNSHNTDRVHLRHRPDVILVQGDLGSGSTIQEPLEVETGKLILRPFANMRREGCDRAGIASF